MAYQDTHTQYTLNFLGKIANTFRSMLKAMQRSRELAAYNKILNDYGNILTENDRNEIRKNMVQAINRK